MEAQRLTINSKNLSDIANEVLKKTQALEIFSAIGQVEVIGSLKLGLMYRRDIDLLVISETIDKAKAQNITKQFLDTGIFRTVALADYLTFPGDDMPLGFYWELIFIHEGKEWKFDVWYLGADEKYTKMVFDAMAKFGSLLEKNPERAEIILQIKEAYFDGVKYKDKVKSIDIYTAVLEKGITNVEAFTEFVKSKLL